MQVGIEIDRLPDQEDLGHLQVITERVAIGDGRQRGQGCCPQREHQEHEQQPVDDRRRAFFGPFQRMPRQLAQKAESSK